MKIYSKSLSIIVAIVMVFVTLMITGNNSKATIDAPHYFKGYTYRLNFTVIYPNIEVYAKNLDTGWEFTTTSDGNGFYDLGVDARQGDDFYLKAWQAIDPSQVDEVYLFHPGESGPIHKTVFHDFSLSPPS